MKVKTKILALMFALCTVHAEAQQLVKDIRPGSANSAPSALCPCNGTLFFFAQDPNLVNGDKELWKTDGTEAGTVRVKEINPDDGDITTSNLYSPACINGTFYFVADDGTHGNELWKSDGTEAGTVMVKDIYPGNYGSNPQSFVVASNKLFFIAKNSSDNQELWVSDGTLAGTKMVKDILPGQYGQNHINDQTKNLVEFNGEVYFPARNVTLSARQLWKSDGTEAGTVMVKEFSKYGPESLTECNGVLYFSAAETATGTELWKTDGTEAGTVLVSDINAGTDGSYPAKLMEYNGSLYFIATTPDYGRELWKTQGDAASTQIVKDTRAGTSSGIGSTGPDSNLKVANGLLYFVATDGINGIELWKSDGSFAGTTMVTDLRPGSESGLGNLAGITYNNYLYFVGNNGATGNELWRTDGTAAGTTLVADVFPGGSTSNSNASPLGIYNGDLYFSAYTPSTGYELWRLGGVSGIQDNNLSGVSIYPNPTYGKMLVEVENAGVNPDFRLLNSLGQQIFSGKLSIGKTEVELNHLPSGVYILQVIGERTIAYKVMKK